MKQLTRLNKTLFNLVVFFIVIALNAPIYHQHVDNHYPKPLKHIDNIASHVHNNDFVNSFETKLEPDFFTEEFHDTHYHLHFEEKIYTIGRIERNKTKTIVVYIFDAFNNLPTHSLALKKQLYDYYKPKYYSNNSAKTFSGLSPPIYST